MSKRLVHLVALFFLSLAVACNGGQEAPRTATPEPSPTGTPAPLTVTPTPAVTEGPRSSTLPVPLEEGVPVTEEGGYVVDVQTGRVWKVADIPAGQWSPNGSVLMIPNCCTGGGMDLVDIERGLTARILSGDIAAVVWSPDGSQIAFSRYEHGPKGLYVMDSDGGGLKQLSENGTWMLQWSPKGDRIAFLGSSDHVYLLDLASGEPIDLGAVSAYPAAWSPDGTELAFANDSGLYVYDAETGDRQQVAAGPSGGPILWSPDGSSIAFRFGPRIPLAHGGNAGDLETGLQAFHVVDVRGSAEPRPLPPARNLSWSPDATRIAYLSEGCITGSWDIYTVDPDGGSPVRLTSTPEGAKEGPVWSPTGTYIAYSTFGELMAIDAQSGELRTLATVDRVRSPGAVLHIHGSEWNASPWSSDGRYVAFHAGFAHGICD